MPNYGKDVNSSGGKSIQPNNKLPETPAQKSARENTTFKPLPKSAVEQFKGQKNIKA